MEIDVWDGEPPSSSSSSDEAANPGAPKAKKEKPEMSIRKRLELRFGRKGAPSKEEPKEASPSPPSAGEESIEPWHSNISTRAEPRVLHGTLRSAFPSPTNAGSWCGRYEKVAKRLLGYTLTKDTSFRAVCKTIREYAFFSSNLPLIVSLEVHTSPEQQDIMVEIMTEYWRGMLLDLPLDPSQPSENRQLPTLKELEKKILVKVKRATHKSKPAEGDAKPTTLQAPAQLTKSTSHESMASNASTTSSSDVPDKPPAPKPKIVDALSRLGVYFGGYHYKGFDSPGKCSNLPGGDVLGGQIGLLSHIRLRAVLITFQRQASRHTCTPCPRRH